MGGWTDVWRQQYVMMLFHKTQVHHKKGETCHDDYAVNFEECKLHKSARVKQCSVQFTPSEVRGFKSKGVYNVCTLLMLPGGSQPPGFG